MKTIRKENDTVIRGSRRSALIASVILTGAVAITATGCETQVKTDGPDLGIVSINTTEAEIDIAPSACDKQEEQPSEPIWEDNDAEEPVNDTAIEENIDDIAVTDPVFGEHDNEDGTEDPVDGSQSLPKDISDKDIELPDDTPALVKLCEDEVLQFDMDENFFYSKSGDYGTFGIEFTAERKVIFYINGNRYEMDTPCSKHTCPYLLKHNGQAYIYIEYLTDSGTEIWAYALSDHGIDFSGRKGNIYLDRDMTSANDFWACETYGDDAIVDITRRFKVGNNGLPQHADTYCYFATRKDITPVYDLTGYVVKNGAVTSEKAEISKDDMVWLVRANETEWLELKKEDGTVIRVDIENLFLNYFTESNERWIYDAIKSLFCL